MTRMSRDKFIKALRCAVNAYCGKPADHDDERAVAVAPKSPEERIEAAIEAAGLKTSDAKALSTIRDMLIRYEQHAVTAPDPLLVIELAENAFVAWQRAAAKENRMKPVPQKQPARMASKRH